MEGFRQAKILLCEDPGSGESSVSDVVSAMGPTVVRCRDGVEAVQRAFREAPDLVILDANTPRLNGYQCARVLKSDPLTRDIPVIIIIGQSGHQIDRYWALASGAEAYLQRPFFDSELEDLLTGMLHKKTESIPAPTRSLSEGEVFKLALDAFDRSLFEGDVIKELSTLDVSSSLIDETVASVMAIIGSLYNYSTGVALFFRDGEGEFFFYPREKALPGRIEEIKAPVLQGVEERFRTGLAPASIRQTLLDAPKQRDSRTPSGDLKVFYGPQGASCVLAFDRMEEDSGAECGGIIEAARVALEKKFLFDAARRLSIIDAADDPNALEFFYSNLGKLMEEASSSGAHLSVFTIIITNFADSIRKLKPGSSTRLKRLITRSIMNSAAKAVIAARTGPADFAFILRNSTVEQGKSVQEKIRAYLESTVNKSLPPQAALTFDGGIASYDPNLHIKAESLLQDAFPNGEEPPARSSKKGPSIRLVKADNGQ